MKSMRAADVAALRTRSEEDGWKCPACGKQNHPGRNKCYGCSRIPPAAFFKELYPDPDDRGDKPEIKKRKRGGRQNRKLKRHRVRRSSLLRPKKARSCKSHCMLKNVFRGLVAVGFLSKSSAMDPGTGVGGVAVGGMMAFLLTCFRAAIRTTEVVEDAVLEVVASGSATLSSIAEAASGLVVAACMTVGDDTAWIYGVSSFIVKAAVTSECVFLLRQLLRRGISRSMDFWRTRRGWHHC